MLRFLSAALLLLTAAAPLNGQVGYAPDRSPYRDLPASTSFTVSVGRFTKDGGQYGLGPVDGMTYSARYAFRANKFIELSLGATKADLQRNLVDPFVATANRTTGPFNESVIITEGGLTANLTGGKTWHRLAPFIGIAAGASFSSGFDAPVDTTTFRSGTRFTFTPHAGTRLFLTDKLHLRLEAKAVFWKLTYPRNSFGSPPPAEPLAAPVVTDNRFREWTRNAILQVGIGYALGFL